MCAAAPPNNEPGGASGGWRTFEKIGVEPLQTGRADAVGELGFRVVAGVEPVPAPFTVRPLHAETRAAQDRKLKKRKLEGHASSVEDPGRRRRQGTCQHTRRSCHLERYPPLVLGEQRVPSAARVPASHRWARPHSHRMPRSYRQISKRQQNFSASGDCAGGPGGAPRDRASAPRGVTNRAEAVSWACVCTGAAGRETRAGPQQKKAFHGGDGTGS
jgi:hypothetical protein